MPDESTPVGTPEVPAGTPPPEGSGNGQEPKPTEKTFPESYVKELRSEGASAREKLRQAEARLQTLENEKLTEQERTAKERDAFRVRAEALETELKEVRLSEMRARIGGKIGLPEELTELLRGETEAEMTAHAERLKKAMPSPQPGPWGGGTTRQSGVPSKPWASRLGARNSAANEVSQANI